MTRTDRAARLIAAPAARIYAALTDQDALATWLPPDGMTGRFDLFEPSVGGSYRLILTYLDAAGSPGKATADSDVVEARFVELEPNSRVAQAVDFVSDDPAYAGTMVMVWEVSEIEEGSLVEFRAEDVPDGISADDHAAGLASSLANLAAYVEH